MKQTTQCAADDLDDLLPAEIMKVCSECDLAGACSAMAPTTKRVAEAVFEWLAIVIAGALAVLSSLHFGL